MDNKSKLCKKLAVGVAALAALSFTVQLAAAASLRTSESLTFIDWDGTTLTFSADDLRAMPQDVEKRLVCAGESAGFIGIFDYSGVRLSRILEKAKASVNARDNKRENLYVVFKGTDGYQVIASWTELMETSGGKRVLIALEKDGQPLPELEGKMRLVLPGDKWVGRSVKCLDRIEIRCAEGYVAK